jgi:hypothetical protein
MAERAWRELFDRAAGRDVAVADVRATLDARRRND